MDDKQPYKSIKMKNLKILSFLFISIVMMSCSKDDNKDNPADNAEFNAIINGGTFSNYSSTLGFYHAEIGISGNSLRIDVTDANNNTINLFINSTGGLDGPVIKEVGNMDTDGFITSANIRDQASMLTYSAISGTITIGTNKENPSDSDYRLITGEFNITANNSTTGEITMIGSFKNLEYAN
jgi:hypothetical protein